MSYEELAAVETRARAAGAASDADVLDGARERHPRDLRRGAQLARLPPLPGGRRRGLARRAERLRAGHPRLRRGAAGLAGRRGALPASVGARSTRGSPRASPRTGSRSPPGWPPRRCRNESRQPDPRRAAQRPAGRRRALAGRRLRRAACWSPAWRCWRSSTAAPTTRSQAAGRRSRRSTARAQQAQAAGRTARALHELHRAARTAHAGRRDARRLALRLGPRPPRVRSRAALRDVDLLAERHDRLGEPDRHRLHDRHRSTSPSAASATTVTSATPPGSVPTFTLAGCATSQPAVALTLERLRLIDGVREVTLQSSTAGTSGGARPAVDARRSDPAFAAHGHLRSAAERLGGGSRDEDRLGLDERRHDGRCTHDLGGERAMTGRDRMVLIAIVRRRGPRRRLDARRLARAQAGEPSSAPRSPPPRRSSRAPKARWRARAPRSRSTRRRTPRS